MFRRRFYAAPDDIDGRFALLSSQETHHLARVLRLREGDEASVFDGCGREYRCRVSLIESRARLEIISELDDETESRARVTLAQSLAKGEKFDFIVQKATELGVSRIVPLATDHTDVKLKEESGAKRLERWRRIAMESLKQCGRRRLVEITSPIALEDFLKSSDSVMLVFSERGGQAINKALADVRDDSAVVALIGPEGGWSMDELNRMEESGCRFVTLGPRVLRTETAAIVALTLIQHAIGDLSW
ncbi:MAG: 16S rRNA (uracil(1498)-N(3))-methyltransferase [Acidobacteriota bacterium]